MQFVLNAASFLLVLLFLAEDEGGMFSEMPVHFYLAKKQYNHHMEKDMFKQNLKICHSSLLRVLPNHNSFQLYLLY
jgi:hypothetical protein